MDLDNLNPSGKQKELLEKETLPTDFIVGGTGAGSKTLSLDWTKVREALGTMAEYRKEFEQKWDNVPFNKLPKFNPKLKCNLRETVYGLYYEGRREQHSKDSE